jgi:Iap family predicted aminopeptidase
MTNEARKTGCGTYTEQVMAHMQRDLHNRINMCEKALQRIDKRIERGIEFDMTEYRERVSRMLESAKTELEDLVQL